MTERVILPEKIGLYAIGERLESGWGWDLYEAYVQAGEDLEARACHLRIFFNQPKDGRLHKQLTEARNKLHEHPHLHIQGIRDVQHVEIAARISSILVEEELLKEWTAVDPSEYRELMLQLVSAVDHLQKIGVPGIGLSKSNLARSRTGTAILAGLSPNWKQLWAGRSRVGETGHYLRLPPESAESPGQFEGAQWVWSSASLLLEALAGIFHEAAPAIKEDVFDTPISAYVNQHPSDFRESQLAGLPEDIQNILRRALASNPEDRFATLAAFSEVLEARIQTGTSGDPYVMPTSSAVQKGSPPPKSRLLRYALGGAVFFLLFAVVFWFAVMHPSRQERAAISSSGAGLIPEPDPEWTKEVKTQESPSTVTAESKDATPHTVEPKPPGRMDTFSRESKDLSVQVPIPSESPPPAEQKTLKAKLASADSTISEPDLESTAQDSVEPSVVEAKPAAQEEPDLQAEEELGRSTEEVVTAAASPALPATDPATDPIDTVLLEPADWKGVFEALSKLSWDEIELRDQERILQKVPAWVAQQKSGMAETDNLPSRSIHLNEVEAFWARSPKKLQSMPPVIALLADIEQRRLTLRIRVANQTEKGVSILDREGNPLSSIDAGDSTVLEVPFQKGDVKMRAQGETPWKYSDKKFQSTPGGFLAWELSELEIHLVNIVPELAMADEEIQIQYSKRGSSESSALQSEIEIFPGDYRFTYTRPDYYSVSKVLRFSRPGGRYKVNLPSQEMWVPKPDLQQLFTWEEQLVEDPGLVIKEIKAKTIQNLESETHRKRLASLQNEMMQLVLDRQVPVEIVLGNPLSPPVLVDVQDDDGLIKSYDVDKPSKVSPGQHRVIFRRSDYEPIEISWQVPPQTKAVQLKFPAESDWLPTPALQSLKRLEKSMDGPGSRDTVRLIQELRTTQFDWLEHEALYKSLRRKWYRQAAGL
jgi:hypothetical protein